MTSSQLTPKDILASKAKFPDSPLLKIDAANTRKNGEGNVTYIPILFKTVSGKWVKIYIKCVRQITSSSAKWPAKVEEKDVKHLNISFQLLNRSAFEGTDYEESKIESLMAANEEFIQALDIIASEYVSLVEREVLTYKGDKFKVGKCKDINNFRQTHRQAGEGENGDEIELPTPIYRIKLPAVTDTKERKIGFNSDGSFKYTVFDMKKTKAASLVPGKKKGPVVARIKVGGKITDLNISNAKHFITFMSLTGGTINFDSVCISKFGMSLTNKFRELHVWRHKALKKDTMDEADMDDMAAYGTAGDDEVEIDEPNDENNDEDTEDKSKNKKSKSKDKGKAKSNKKLSKALEVDDDEEHDIDEPEENEASAEEESEQKVDDQDNASDAENQSDEDSDEEPVTKKSKSKSKSAKETPKDKSKKEKEVKDTKSKSKAVKETPKDKNKKEVKDTKSKKEVKSKKEKEPVESDNEEDQEPDEHEEDVDDTETKPVEEKVSKSVKKPEKNKNTEEPVDNTTEDTKDNVVEGTEKETAEEATEDVAEEKTKVKPAAKAKPPVKAAAKKPAAGASLKAGSRNK